MKSPLELWRDWRGKHPMAARAAIAVAVITVPLWWHFAALVAVFYLCLSIYRAV